MGTIRELAVVVVHTTTTIHNRQRCYRKVHHCRNTTSSSRHHTSLPSTHCKESPRAKSTSSIIKLQKQSSNRREFRARASSYVSHHLLRHETSTTVPPTTATIPMRCQSLSPQNAIAASSSKSRSETCNQINQFAQI
ncbi:hypothetical protein LR48_Vigan03g184400 [Vigna angularis]|uniref:Uncharacterized protein n=1 Tax=Phaseolus angularis TaxID=3914 RepID=A0A0L9U723_PHAAN|nr:hypothetical protein LR48_Vigan2550s000100 [Vigna angularis]KOM38462.1 hypothetical protein LR48_Vigan03g184400 [Vigna angularis]